MGETQNLAHLWYLIAVFWIWAEKRKLGIFRNSGQCRRGYFLYSNAGFEAQPELVSSQKTHRRDYFPRETNK